MKLDYPSQRTCSRAPFPVFSPSPRQAGSTALLCCLALWLAGFTTSAQQSRLEETPLDNAFLRDYAATRGFMLGRPTRAQPTPDGRLILFLRAQARVPRLSLLRILC